MIIFSKDLDKTVICVIHNIKYAKKADMIYRIDNGGIANCGTHEELIKTDTVYKKLYYEFNNN